MVVNYTAAPLSCMAGYINFAISRGGLDTRTFEKPSTSPAETNLSNAPRQTTTIQTTTIENVAFPGRDILPAIDTFTAGK